MRYQWTAVVLACLVVTTLGGGAWLIWRGAHHKLYDAAFLPIVAQRITRAATSREEVVARLQEFTYLNLRISGPAPVLDSEPEHVLLRGYAYCDQAVFVFIHLLREKGIPGRLTWLRRGSGVSPHTVSEVLLDGEWRVFDTYFNFVPRRRDGRAATIADLVAEPTLLGPSRAAPEWYQHAKSTYTIDPAVPEFPSARANAQKALIRWIVARAPGWVVDRLQDLYLFFPVRAIPDERLESGGRDARLFLRARHYHVFLRAREAESAYRELLKRYSSSALAEHALYNLALLQLTQLRDPRVAIETASTLLSRNPQTAWRPEVQYLKARAHEEAGECPAAVDLYRVIAEGSANGAEDARARLARLWCR